MTFLIQQTLIYAVPLMIVALAGVFAERSGIINLALEGIMIFGAFAGVLFVRLSQQAGFFVEAKADGDWVALQGFMILAMVVAAVLGAIFSLLLSFASVNLKADQTIGGTALNLLAPALVLAVSYSTIAFQKGTAPKSFACPFCWAEWCWGWKRCACAARLPSGWASLWAFCAARRSGSSITSAPPSRRWPRCCWESPC